MNFRVTFSKCVLDNVQVHNSRAYSHADSIIRATVYSINNEGIALSSGLLSQKRRSSLVCHIVKSCPILSV